MRIHMKSFLAVLLTAGAVNLIFPAVPFAEVVKAANEAVAEEASAADGSSVVGEVFPFYLDSLEEEYELPVYFLNGIRDLPYIDLSDWADVMTVVFRDYLEDKNYSLELETDGNVAMLTRDNMYSMLVDFKAGTITFEDYDAFVHNSGESSLLDVVSSHYQAEDGKDILIRRNTKGSFDRYGKEIELNLTDYNIPLYWSEENDLYLIPLQTLGDFLMSGSALLNTFFNEEAVYLTSFGMLVDGGELTELGKHYYSAPYKKMSEELAWYSYCELCLALDNLYGLKELHGIDSFDQVFREIGYKNDLTSTDPGIVDGALNDFIEYYLDDLHSVLEQVSYRTEELNSDEGKGLSTLQSDADEETYKNARDNASSEVPAYEEVGNTAYVSFDGFDYFCGADEYYDGKGEVPALPSDVPMDTIALILYAHKQITREGSPIENVVMDLSNNTGGAVDAACVAASWFLGEVGFNMKSTFTGAHSTGIYQVDVNLDGEYDEKDTVADKNLFCLVSPVSFSCGNLVPSVLKSAHKATLLGQTTGGGSCIVLPMTTAYGSCFRISSPLNMSYVKNGSYYAIDEGVEPDVYIAKPEHFYDREALTKYINDLF